MIDSNKWEVYYKHMNSCSYIKMRGRCILKRDIQKEHAESCEMLHHHDEIIKMVIGEMPPEEDLYDLADFFKVFADTTRIKILYVLLKQEMCVCDIAQTLEMTQSAISHQLRILKQMDLVKNRRDGKTIYYSLADNHIASILNQGMDHINE